MQETYSTQLQLFQTRNCYTADKQGDGVYQELHIHKIQKKKKSQHWNNLQDNCCNYLNAILLLMLMNFKNGVFS